MSSFVKATKAEVKSRLAFTGPAGSGKSFTSLQWATVLAEGGKIAAIDTERESLKLYADQFDFDYMGFAPPYNPERLITAINDAATDNYAVLDIDSLTHFWNGAGGILEMVDSAGARGGGNFAGWKIATPIQQKMVDTILAFPGHVICTMRSKTEYVIEQNDRGKMQPKKMGMAPIQRDGMEYEFTMVIEMDTDHRLLIGKNRCAPLDGRTFTMSNSLEAANIFLTWLKSGDPLLKVEDREALDASIRSLTPGQRRALAVAWGEKGLPRVGMVTEAQATSAKQLVVDASNTPDAVGAPTTEVVPA